MSILSDTAMWLESHGNLARHPKTRRLMQRMGWTLPHTIGNLHLLWWWALEYAPTGDLTNFEPEQITYDLDLGSATPEQFLGAMIEAGFLDKDENNPLRIHDWPDYTTKCLRPRFRRDPEKWHNVLRSYDRPIPARRQRRTPSLAGRQLPPARAGEEPNLPVPPRRDPADSTVSSSNSTRNNAPALEQIAEPCAGREPKMVEYEPLGAARIDCVEDTARQGVGSGCDCSQMDFQAVPRVLPSAPAESENEFAIALKSDPTPQKADAAHANDISLGDLSLVPKCLSGRRNFNGWWIKLQEQYQNKGCPMTAHEQHEVLAMLARNPFAAVEKLQYSVVNFEKSYATLLAPLKNQPANSS